MANEELKDLKEKATKLGLEFPKNAGVKKMAEVLAAADEKIDDMVEEVEEMVEEMSFEGKVYLGKCPTTKKRLYAGK